MSPAGTRVLTLAAVVFACRISSTAEDLSAQALRLRPAASIPSEDTVVRNLASRMQSKLDSIHHARNRAEADLARPRLRRALETSLGYKLLPWPPDLRSRVVSTVRKDGYRVENLVFQSLPGEWIPANLYLPDVISKPAPAVLFYNGHWFPDSKARPDFQSFCINMAKFGFVVLNFEALGQGERGLSWRDHRRSEGLLVGVAQQGFAVYDTQAAIEYLSTRKEVDPDSIGMTGASGGGFDTWMNAALDDRIKVAVPVVGTCDFGEQAMVRIGRDWDPYDQCHYVPGLFQYANNHELLTMAAPKPVLVVSATDDKSFPIRGVREVVEFGRRLYASYGLAARFGYSEDSSEAHGYQIKKREAAYGWFLRWLMQKGDGSAVREPSTATLPPDSPELRGFLPASAWINKRAAGPPMISALQDIAKRPPAQPTSLDLEKVLGPWPKSPLSVARLSNARMQRVMVRSETDLQIPTVLLRPGGEARGLLVTVDDRGKESVFSDPLIENLAREGWAVLSVDPRGIGELASSRKTWIFAISLMSGENFVWRQAWDILRAVEAIGSAPELRSTPLALYARGEDASLAASYLLAREGQTGISKLRWAILREGFTTFHDFLDRPKSMPLSYRLISSQEDRDRPLDREIPGSYIPFGVLRFFDIPKLLNASKIPALLVDPIDGDWVRKDADAARKSLNARIRVVSDGDPEAAMDRFARAR